MWYSQGNIFYLIKKNEFTIGRRNCDLLIEDDLSVSKKHALIRIKENGSLTIQDCGSKYKTVLNNVKLNPEEEVPLETNAKIKFGVFETLYRLEQKEIITAATALNGHEKKNLKKVLDIIGATLVDNWGPQCTHLTVKEMSVTIKVLNALLDEKPIVLLRYWTQFAKNALKNRPPPDIEQFNKPPVAEPMLTNLNFTEKVNRRVIFKNKELIFGTDENKKLVEDVIQKTGGTTRSWERNPVPLSHLFKSRKDIIVIQVADEKESSSFQELLQAVVKRGQRPVPLQEIALAVISGSCETNCNPNFDRVSAVFAKSVPSLPANILVTNTQSDVMTLAASAQNETLKVIPATFEPHLDDLTTETPPSQEHLTKKRKNKQAVDMVIEKKLKIEVERMNISSNSKDTHPEKNIAMVKNRNTYSQYSLNTANKRKMEDEELESFSTKRLNPFAVYMHKNKDSTDTDLENLNKRFKTEDKSADLGTSSVNVTTTPENTDLNIFKRPATITLSRNCPVPTERSFSNESHIFSSTRRDIETSPIKSSRHLSKEFLSSIQWISNSTDLPQARSVKIDPELKEIAERFVGKTVIKYVKTTTSVRTSSFRNPEIVSVGNSTKINFKKFKKVMPKKPQKTIIISNCVVQANSMSRRSNDEDSLSARNDNSNRS